MPPFVCGTSHRDGRRTLLRFTSHVNAHVHRNPHWQTLTNSNTPDRARRGIREPPVDRWESKHVVLGVPPDVGRTQSCVDSSFGNMEHTSLWPKQTEERWRKKAVNRSVSPEHVRQRWAHQFGGVMYVVALRSELGETHVGQSLRRCDGGEVVKHVSIKVQDCDFHWYHCEKVSVLYREFTTIIYPVFFWKIPVTSFIVYMHVSSAQQLTWVVFCWKVYEFKCYNSSHLPCYTGYVDISEVSNRINTLFTKNCTKGKEDASSKPKGLLNSLEKAQNGDFTHEQTLLFSSIPKGTRLCLWAN